MSYLQFHLLFILPPLLLLVFTRSYNQRQYGRIPDSISGIIWGIAGIALVYTTPWDNYLVYNAVWTYGSDRVIGTIGYVPLEEYAFFVLQPLLTGYWFDLVRCSYEQRPARTPPPTLDAAQVPGAPSFIGAGVWIVLTTLGLWFLTNTQTFYLGCILAWSGPVGSLQWIWKGDTFWRYRRPLFLGVAAPSLYLWIVDRIAIGQNIWSISSNYTIGWHLVGLPIEEAVFFVVTNLMVVQGILMFIHDPAKQSDIR